MSGLFARPAEIKLVSLTRLMTRRRAVQDLAAGGSGDGLFDLARRDAELFAREGCGCPGCNLAPRWLSQVERLPSDPV